MRFASEASLPVRVCACACGPFFGSPHRVGVRVFVCLHCRPALEQLALLPVTVAATSVSSSSSSASSSSSRYRRGPLRSSDLSRTRRAAQQVRTAFVFLCVCVCVSVCVCVGYAKTSPDSLSLRSPCSFLALPRSPLPLSLPRMCRVQNTAFHQRLRETRARLNGAAVAFLSQWQQWFVDEHSRRFRLVRRPAVLGRGRKQGLMSAAPGDNEYMHTHTHSLTLSLSHTQLTLTHTHAHHLCVSLPPCAGNGCLLLSGVTLGSRWPHGRHTK